MDKLVFETWSTYGGYTHLALMCVGAAAAGRFRGVCALIASTLMEGTSQSCNAVGAGLSLGVPSFGNDKQLTHMRWGGDGGALPQGLCAHFCARTLVE